MGLCAQEQMPFSCWVMQLMFPIKNKKTSSKRPMHFFIGQREFPTAQSEQNPFSKDLWSHAKRSICWYEPRIFGSVDQQQGSWLILYMLSQISSWYKSGLPYWHLLLKDVVCPAGRTFLPSAGVCPISCGFKWISGMLLICQSAEGWDRWRWFFMVF